MAKSFAETHSRNLNATCKCEHWQSCIDCHPTAHGEKYITDAMRVRQAVSNAVLQENKEGSPCPEFWDWLPKAYNFDGNGSFTKYNMEVAFLAGKQASQPAQQEPVAWLELLREARDNCKASIVEEGISASRKEYRIDLEARLTAALNTSPPPQRKPLTDEEIMAIGKELGLKCRFGGNPNIDFDYARAIEAAHNIKENT